MIKIMHDIKFQLKQQFIDFKKHFVTYTFENIIKLYAGIRLFN